MSDSVNPYTSPDVDLDNDAQTIDQIQNPPTTMFGILRRLGPGLILAASIVGSGELIATTKTGAQAGFSLLWFILIGCVIKVLVQVEIGRFTITEGRTAVEAFDLVPGPRLRVSWLCWYWAIMYFFMIVLLGGIIGITGQTAAIAFPITGDYNQHLESLKTYDEKAALEHALASYKGGFNRSSDAKKELSASERQAQIEKQLGPRPNAQKFMIDEFFWCALFTVATSIMLVIGKYGFVQNAATLMVAVFTGVNVLNLIALQTRPDWAISFADIWSGLQFRLPEVGGMNTALATFGIIGVGATELVAYPYWCLEKGYARATGKRDASSEWGSRAKGWMRVMRWDCWCSMIIYTFATITFYFIGASVLHRQNLNPTDDQVIPTLLKMYEPVFGKGAVYIVMIGAFAVLYSTFFIATASNAMTGADGLRVFRLGVTDQAGVKRWTKILCGVLPLMSLAIFCFSKQPVSIILIGGLVQSIMLPMLGFAALYFRYKRCDKRLEPGFLWSICLWVSVLLLFVLSGWGAYNKFAANFGSLF